MFGKWIILLPIIFANYNFTLTWKIYWQYIIWILKAVHGKITARMYRGK